MVKSFATGALLLLFSYSLFFLLPNEQLISLTEEDGIVEWTGAVFLFLAAVFFFLSYWKNQHRNNFRWFKTSKNIFYLLLGILFLFGFFEEISWGQRIFNISTPEALKKINNQDEITIHNLYFFFEEDGWKKYLNENKLLTIFWFSFCILVPVLNKTSRLFRRIFTKLNLPVPPLFVSALFLLNYLLVKLTQWNTPIELGAPLVELKETDVSFLFFVTALWFFFQESVPDKRTHAQDHFHPVINPIFSVFGFSPL